MARRSKKRISSQEKAAENAKLFVNRIDAQEVVANVYDEITEMADFDLDMEEDYRIVNFYGVGGKGKTSLANKLIANFKDESNYRSEPLFIKWDASRTEENSYALSDVLVHLRNQLVQKYNFQFSEFDKLVEHYNIIAKTTPLFLEEFIDPKSYSTGNTFLSVFKSVLIGGVDLFPGGAAARASISEIRKNLKERKQKKQKAKEQAAYLSESITMEELERKMKEAFEIDYEACMKSIKQPVVIFIDTSEDIPYQLGSIEAGHLYSWLISGHDDEDYGYGLIHSLPKTFWVICGREAIDYRDEDWSGSVFRSYQLNNLAKEDTQFFLMDKCQVEEQSIIEDIWQETEGNPLLLRMYYDLMKEDDQFLLTYHEQKSLIKERETDTLVKVFLRYIDFDQNTESNSEQGKLMRLLIALGEWTKEEFIDFYRQLDENTRELTDFSETEIAFDLITQKSIVQAETMLDSGDVVYRFDRMFQDAIFHATYNNVPIVSEETKRRTLEFLSKREQLRDNQLRQLVTLSLALSTNLSEGMDVVLTYVQQPLVTLKERGEYERYFRLTIQSLVTLAKAYPRDAALLNRFVHPVLREQIDTQVFSLVALNEELCSFIELDDASVLALSDYYLEIGYAKESAQVLRRSVRIMETLDFNPYRLRELNLLRSGDIFETEIISTFGKRLVGQRFASSVEELYSQFNLIVNLIISEIQAEQIDAAKQYGFYLFQLFSSQKEQFTELFLKSMLYLHRTDFENEAPQDTLFFVNELLHEETVPLFIHDARALEQLSNLSRKLLEDAPLVGEPFRQGAVRISDLLLEVGLKRGKFGRNLVTASVLEDGAYINLYFNQFGAVEPLIHEALNIRGAILGEEHPKTIDLHILKGMYFYRSKQWEASEEILLPLVEKRASLETLAQQRVGELYQYVGMLHWKRRNYKEAIGYFEKADETLTALYGREHWKAVISHAEYLHRSFISLLYEENDSDEMRYLATRIERYCDFLEVKDLKTSIAMVFNHETGQAEEKEIRYGNNLNISANNSKMIEGIVTLLKRDLDLIELEREKEYFDTLHALLEQVNQDENLRDDLLNKGITIGFTMGYLAILYYVYDQANIQPEFIEIVNEMEARQEEIEQAYRAFIYNDTSYNKLNQTFMEYSPHGKVSFSADDLVQLCSDYIVNGMIYSMEKYVAYEGNFRNKEEFYTRGFQICQDIAVNVVEYELYFRYLVVTTLEEILQ